MQNYNYKRSLRDRCYQFGLQIMDLLDSLPNNRSAWVIADQLIRSATSIGANVIEAKGSSTRKEFKRFYEIALKSSNESEYWLSLLKDRNLGNLEKAQNLFRENNELTKMLATAVIKLKT